MQNYKKIHDIPNNREKRRVLVINGKNAVYHVFVLSVPKIW